LKKTLSIFIILILTFAGITAAEPSQDILLQPVPGEPVSEKQVTEEQIVTEDISGEIVKKDPAAGQSGRVRRPVKEPDTWVDTLRKMFTVWIFQLLKGAVVTIGLSILAVSTGLILSLFLALGKMSRPSFAMSSYSVWDIIKYYLKAALGKICSGYVFFFRGTPLLMQIYFIYYALPMINPVFTINNRFLAAYIAFSLNAAAYLAEIIRAAIQSIDKGQFEASRALGLSYASTMRLVIIPQSIRRLIPPVGNEFIMMLKDVSLVSMIALVDITKATRNIESSTRSALVYIPAMILYLIINAIFTFLFKKKKKKYSVYE
jgi:polar amino acid transport system permease protein